MHLPHTLYMLLLLLLLQFEVSIKKFHYIVHDFVAHTHMPRAKCLRKNFAQVVCKTQVLAKVLVISFSFVATNESPPFWVPERAGFTHKSFLIKAD